MESEIFFSQVYEDINDSPEHKEYESEIIKLGRKIMEQLGTERTLFLDYEKLVYLMEGYRLESAYKIGVRERDNKEV